MTDSMDDNELDNIAAMVEATVVAKLIEPYLVDREPEIVGAILAQLLAAFIAGHAPPLRKAACKCVVDGATSMVPLIVDQLIEDGHAEPEWKSMQ